jgi:BON domain
MQRRSTILRTVTLLVAGALAASCATTGPIAPPPPAHSGADALLANDVYLALNADPVYFYRHVDVRVDDGVADLSGYVWSTDAIYRARRIARGVPGINRVVTSHLELEREGFSNGRAR